MNYEEFEMMFNKIRKDCQDPKDPINNKNFNLVNPGKDK